MGEAMAEKTLFVVDDEPEIANIISEIAQIVGFKTTTASSAKELWKFRSGHPDPDVIVIDLIMPEMDGIEILQRLGAENCASKLVLVSGYDERYLETARTLAAAYELNVAHCFTKPFDFEVLKTSLEEI